MPGTADSFVTALVASGLMSATEAETALMHLPRAQLEDSQAIAQAFFTQGKLTAYQAKELLAGRHGGLLLGNYAILDKLGAGGMGVVYKAQHRRMKRVVALKMLPPQVVHSEEALKRFLREVEAAARLTHNNIVTAYDADCAEGVHFLVMQYVEGSDLAHYVRRAGKLSVRNAIDYTLQAARGLHYAHQKGVIHRDIKPGNLLLDNDGVVRVLDMGLARLEEREGEQSAFQTKDELTGTGRVIGTVDYMAPEQTLDAKHVDRRADIYSLGCTLHFFLTGRSPAPDGSLTEKLLWHESGPSPSLLDARPDVPPELNVVFRRMMARKPADRYPTFAEAIAELEVCLERIGGPSDPTQDHRKPGFKDVDTVAVVIPEVVEEVPPPRLPLASPPREPPASAETHRGQTYPDATIVEHAVMQITQTAKARRREQAMVLPAVGIGVCLVAVLVLVMMWSADRGRSSRTGWNEDVKEKLEELLLRGVTKPDGRQIYTEIDTALESGREGDWKIGAGLTKDGKAYAISVRDGRMQTRTLSANEALASGLNSGSTQSSLDSSFPHRTQSLVMLAKPELRLVTGSAGDLRLQGTVFCTASAYKNVEDAALLLQRRTQQGRQTQTQAVFQNLLDWRRLKSGTLYIDVAAPNPPPAIGETMSLVLVGFLQEPKPSLYRMSNEPGCTILGPASTVPGIP